MGEKRYGFAPGLIMVPVHGKGPRYFRENSRHLILAVSDPPFTVNHSSPSNTENLTRTRVTSVSCRDFQYFP